MIKYSKSKNTLVEPHCLSKFEDHDASRKFIYRNHTLKITTPTGFRKIGFTRLARQLVRREAENYRLFSSMAELSRYLPTVVLKNGPIWVSLKIERLRPLNFDASDALIKVLKCLKAQSVDISFENYILRYRDYKLFELLQPLLARSGHFMVPVGPSHGDFHDENIMVDTAGHLKMIDVDLFSPSRMYYFDLLNIFVSRNILRHGLPWQLALDKTWSEQEEINNIDGHWVKCSSSEKQSIFTIYLLIRYEQEIDFSNSLKLDDRLLSRLGEIHLSN